MGHFETDHRLTPPGGEIVSEMSEEAYNRLLHTGVAHMNVVSSVHHVLRSIYQTHPALSPENMAAMEVNDDVYRDFFHNAYDSTEIAALDQQIAQVAATPAQMYATYANTLVAQLAGRRAAGDEIAYKRLLSQPYVKPLAASQLVASLELFTHPNVVTFSQDTYDDPMFTQALSLYQQSVEPQHTLPEPEGPPLHLTQLAADVINFNSLSVAGLGPWTVFRRVRSKSIEVQQVTKDKQVISEAVGAYVARRYEDEGLKTDQAIGKILIECILAERQVALELTYAEKTRITDRIQQVVGKNHVSRHALPSEAAEIIERFTF